MKKITSFFEKKFFYLIHIIDITNNKILNKLNKLNFKIILVVSIFFLYLFYLSIPAIYNKKWVTDTFQKEIQKEFGINFKFISDISYRPFPLPHFYVEESSIISNKVDLTDLSNVKKLKIFISQKNFFKRNDLKILDLSIDQTNFSLNFERLKYFTNLFTNSFSEKKILVRNSSFTFSDKEKTVFINLLRNLEFFFDNQTGLNKFIMKSEIFNVPYEFIFENDLTNKSSSIKITSKKLNFNFLNNIDLTKNGITELNIFNIKLSNKFSVNQNEIKFISDKSSTINYSGNLNLKPFSANVVLDLKKVQIGDILNNPILIELLKSNILFNRNLDVKLKLNINQLKNIKIINNSVFNFDFKEGKINYDNSLIKINKFGKIKFTESDLSLNNLEFISTGKLIFKIDNPENFYKHFHISKKYRKKLSNIKFNYEYNIFRNEIKINKFFINDKEVNVETQDLIDRLNSTKKISNPIKFRNIVKDILISL